MNRAVKKQWDALKGFLLDPRSHTPAPRQVRTVETHSAWIFIAPPFVYKIKKPVQLGFLDFSTLARRRQVLEQEKILNRRLTSGVYLEVVPIRRGPHGLTWQGKAGPAKEYALRMKHLAPGYFMDRRVDQGRLQAKDLERVVQVLGAFYRAHPPDRHVASWGRLSKLRISTNENFRQTRPFLGEVLPHGSWQCIRDFTRQFYRKHAELLQRRVDQGWIRDGHGDLRLEHIHLTRKAVQIIDCVEFNDRLRFVDVASDVAFLAMDLDFHGRPDWSRLLVRRMALEMEDRDMTALMDFYKCYRAFVRGKVECLQAQSARVPSPDSHAPHPERARQFFQWALRYAVFGSGPFVLVIMGGIATGKSAVAEALARRLGVKVVSSDRIRKDRAGVPLHARSPAGVRKRIYRPAMTKRVYAELARQALRETRLGHGVVLDATYGRRRWRDALRRTLQRARIPSLFIETQVPQATAAARLKDRARRGTDVSDARLEDWQSLAARYEPPVELPGQERLSLGTRGKIEESVDRCLKTLASSRPGWADMKPSEGPL